MTEHVTNSQATIPFQVANIRVNLYSLGCENKVAQVLVLASIKWLKYFVSYVRTPRGQFFSTP